jgi:hypothetical protein
VLIASICNFYTLKGNEVIEWIFQLCDNEMDSFKEITNKILTQFDLISNRNFFAVLVYVFVISVATVFAEHFAILSELSTALKMKLFSNIEISRAIGKFCTLNFSLISYLIPTYNTNCTTSFTLSVYSQLLLIIKTFLHLPRKEAVNTRVNDKFIHVLQQF